jgi:hypothetical protein
LIIQKKFKIKLKRNIIKLIGKNDGSTLFYSSDLKLKYERDPDNLTNSRVTRPTKKNSKDKIKGK